MSLVHEIRREATFDPALDHRPLWQAHVVSQALLESQRSNVLPMSARVEPLSIESLLQKQKADKEAASKVTASLLFSQFLHLNLQTQPKFLSKEERAKLAIAQRAQEIREQKEKEENTKKDREALEREAEELRQREWNQGSKRYGNGGGGRCQYTSTLLSTFHNLSFTTDKDRYAHPERDRGDRSKRDRDGRDGRGRYPPPSSQQQEERRPQGEGYQNVPTGPRAARHKGSVNGPSSSMPPPPVPASASNTLPEPSAPFVPPMTDDDLSAIRSRYLGVDKKKRKIRKMNDRKFVFDWDAQDDTFSEDSPVAVGSNRQGAQVMFGRGRLAGMDDGGGSGTRKVSVDPHLADSLERRRAAKSGLDERHWTDKPLEEMKDRDWRIFREDFSISARGPFSVQVYFLLSKSVVGGHIPHPLRSWTESSIPPLILECIEKIGYKDPSPIQRQAIPIGLQNRDIIGIAETGV